MKTSRVVRISQWVVLLMAFGNGANAAVPADGPCVDDIKKFCADVKPGASRIAACLKGRAAELSAACKTHQEQIRAKVDTFDAACGADAKKLCSDVKPGKTSAMRCLNDKNEQLSSDCKIYMEKRGARMQKGHGPGPMGK